MCSMKSKSCNLMVNFCFDLFELKIKKFVFPIKLCPYIECAISIIPSIKSDICIGLGPEFHFGKGDSEENSFNIDLSGGASAGVTLDFGVYIPSLKSPIRFSFNVGLTGILGSGKVGIQLFLYFKEKFKVDLYYEFKAFEFSFYVMFTLSFQIELFGFEINFSFSFYVYQKIFCGFKYIHHNERIYKYGGNKIEHVIKRTKNGRRYGKDKVNKVISETYELL